MEVPCWCQCLQGWQLLFNDKWSSSIAPNYETRGSISDNNSSSSTCAVARQSIHSHGSPCCNGHRKCPWSRSSSRSCGRSATGPASGTAIIRHRGPKSTDSNTSSSYSHTHSSSSMGSSRSSSVGSSRSSSMGSSRSSSMGSSRSSSMGSSRSSSMGSSRSSGRDRACTSSSRRSGESVSIHESCSKVRSSHQETSPHDSSNSNASSNSDNSSGSSSSRSHMSITSFTGRRIRSRSACEEDASQRRWRNVSSKKQISTVWCSNSKSGRKEEQEFQANHSMHPDSSSTGGGRTSSKKNRWKLDGSGTSSSRREALISSTHKSVGCLWPVMNSHCGSSRRLLHVYSWGERRFLVSSVFNIFCCSNCMQLSLLVYLLCCAYHCFTSISHTATVLQWCCSGHSCYTQQRTSMNSASLVLLVLVTTAASAVGGADALSVSSAAVLLTAIAAAGAIIGITPSAAVVALRTTCAAVAAAAGVISSPAVFAPAVAPCRSGAAVTCSATVVVCTAACVAHLTVRLLLLISQERNVLGTSCKMLLKQHTCHFEKSKQQRLQLLIQSVLAQQLLRDLVYEQQHWEVYQCCFRKEEPVHVLQGRADMLCVWLRQQLRLRPPYPRLERCQQSSKQRQRQVLQRQLYRLPFLGGEGQVYIPQHHQERQSTQWGNHHREPKKVHQYKQRQADTVKSEKHEQEMWQQEQGQELQEQEQGQQQDWTQEQNQTVMCGKRDIAAPHNRLSCFSVYELPQQSLLGSIIIDTRKGGHRSLHICRYATTRSCHTVAPLAACLLFFFSFSFCCCSSQKNPSVFVEAATSNAYICATNAATAAAACMLSSAFKSNIACSSFCKGAVVGLPGAAISRNPVQTAAAVCACSPARASITYPFPPIPLSPTSAGATTAAAATGARYAIDAAANAPVGLSGLHSTAIEGAPAASPPVNTSLLTAAAAPPPPPLPAGITWSTIEGAAAAPPPLPAGITWSSRAAAAAVPAQLAFTTQLEAAEATAGMPLMGAVAVAAAPLAGTTRRIGASVGCTGSVAAATGVVEKKAGAQRATWVCSATSKATAVLLPGTAKGTREVSAEASVATAAAAATSPAPSATVVSGGSNTISGRKSAPAADTPLYELLLHLEGSSCAGGLGPIVFSIAAVHFIAARGTVIIAAATSAYFPRLLSLQVQPTVAAVLLSLAIFTNVAPSSFLSVSLVTCAAAGGRAAAADSSSSDNIPPHKQPSDISAVSPGGRMTAAAAVDVAVDAAGALVASHNNKEACDAAVGTFSGAGGARNNTSNSSNKDSDTSTNSISTANTVSNGLAQERRFSNNGTPGDPSGGSVRSSCSFSANQEDSSIVSRVSFSAISKNRNHTSSVYRTSEVHNTKCSSGNNKVHRKTSRSTSQRCSRNTKGSARISEIQIPSSSHDDKESNHDTYRERNTSSGDNVHIEGELRHQRQLPPAGKGVIQTLTAENVNIGRIKTHQREKNPQVAVVKVNSEAKGTRERRLSRIEDENVDEEKRHDRTPSTIHTERVDFEGKESGHKTSLFLYRGLKQTKSKQQSQRQDPAQNQQQTWHAKREWSRDEQPPAPQTGKVLQNPQKTPRGGRVLRESKQQPQAVASTSSKGNAAVAAGGAEAPVSLYNRTDTSGETENSKGIADAADTVEASPDMTSSSSSNVEPVSSIRRDAEHRSKRENTRGRSSERIVSSLHNSKTSDRVQRIGSDQKPLAVRIHMAQQKGDDSTEQRPANVESATLYTEKRSSSNSSTSIQREDAAPGAKIADNKLFLTTPKGEVEGEPDSQTEVEEEAASKAAASAADAAAAADAGAAAFAADAGAAAGGGGATRREYAPETAIAIAGEKVSTSLRPSTEAEEESISSFYDVAARGVAAAWRILSPGKALAASAASSQIQALFKTSKGETAAAKPPHPLLVSLLYVQPKKEGKGESQPENDAVKGQEKSLEVDKGQQQQPPSQEQMAEKDPHKANVAKQQESPHQRGVDKGQSKGQDEASSSSSSHPCVRRVTSSTLSSTAVARSPAAAVGVAVAEGATKETEEAHPAAADDRQVGSSSSTESNNAATSDGRRIEGSSKSRVIDAAEAAVAADSQLQFKTGERQALPAPAGQGASEKHIPAVVATREGEGAEKCCIAGGEKECDIIDKGDEETENEEKRKKEQEKEGVEEKGERGKIEPPVSADGFVLAGSGTDDAGGEATAQRHIYSSTSHEETMSQEVGTNTIKSTSTPPPWGVHFAETFEGQMLCFQWNMINGAIALTLTYLCSPMYYSAAAAAARGAAAGAAIRYEFSSSVFAELLTYLPSFRLSGATTPITRRQHEQHRRGRCDTTSVSSSTWWWTRLVTRAALSVRKVFSRLFKGKQNSAYSALATHQDSQHDHHPQHQHQHASTAPSSAFSTASSAFRSAGRLVVSSAIAPAVRLLSRTGQSVGQLLLQVPGVDAARRGTQKFFRYFTASVPPSLLPLSSFESNVSFTPCSTCSSSESTTSPADMAAFFSSSSDISQASKIHVSHYSFEQKTSALPTLFYSTERGVSGEAETGSARGGRYASNIADAAASAVVGTPLFNVEELGIHGAANTVGKDLPELGEADDTWVPQRRWKFAATSNSNYSGTEEPYDITDAHEPSTSAAEAASLNLREGDGAAAPGRRAMGGGVAAGAITHSPPAVRSAWRLLCLSGQAIQSTSAVLHALGCTYTSPTATLPGWLLATLSIATSFLHPMFSLFSNCLSAAYDVYALLY